MSRFRCVILAAVSDPQQVRDDRGDDKESIPSQIADARALIARRSWAEVAEPLIIPGQSRSINWLHEAFEEIDAYQKLRVLADGGLIDLVVCRDYDRLARTSALQQQISAYLKERRIQIFALQMPVEPHDPATWRPRSDNTRVWVEAIAGARSESYVNQLVHYHQMGMEGRVKAGRHNEGIPPYGYRDVTAEDGFGRSKRKRVPDPAEYPILQMILRKLIAGETGVAVARWLDENAISTRKGGRWTPSGVIQIARNPWYGGKVARYRFRLSREGKRRRRGVREQPGLLVDGVHEAPLTWDEWTRLQETITERARFVPRLRRRDYLWSGLAVCGYGLDAGDVHSMRHCRDRQRNADGTVRTYDYLICSRYSSSGGRLCQRNTIVTRDFVSALGHWIAAAIADPGLIDAVANEPADDPLVATRLEWERISTALTQIQEEERRWDDAYRRGIISLEKYAAGLSDLAAQRTRLDESERRIRLDLAQTRSIIDRRRERRAILASLAACDLIADDPEVVRAVHQLVERVIIRGGHLQIVPR